jgi:hypothetical protein
MEPAQAGYFLGMFLGTILFPVIILIVCNFFPAGKRNPKVVYSSCGVLAVLIAFLVGGNWLRENLLAVLGALFFFWGYRRATKKNA